MTENENKKISRSELKKKLHQKMESTKAMHNVRSKMMSMKTKPDLSNIDKMSKSELKDLAKLTGSTVEQLSEISKSMQIQNLLTKNQKTITNLNDDFSDIRIENRKAFVESEMKAGKFKDGTPQELKLIHSFMDKLKNEKDNLPHIHKDKLKSWVILYHKLHGLGLERTPKNANEWKEYGISPDEILTKVQYNNEIRDEQDLSDLSDLSDDE